MGAQDASIVTSLYAADEWKKIVHSLPAVYAAIISNPAVLVREFLHTTIRVDLPYNQLIFSVRAMNCLSREALPDKSIQSILDMPLIQLASMKNAGAKTIQEILTVVANYVKSNPSSETTESTTESELPFVAHNFIPLKPYADLIAHEEWEKIEERLETEEDLSALLSIIDISNIIGPEMVAAALSSSYPTDIFLPSLQEFILKEEKHTIRRQELQRLINLLPEGRAALPVMPFVVAWPSQSAKGTLRKIVDDIICFNELTNIASEIDDDEYDTLSSFLTWCQTDIRAEIRRIINGCIKSERQEEVVKLRGEGKTLEEIRVLYNITRERVRQIEAKAVRAFSSFDAGRILHLISADRKGDEILTIDELKAYGDENGIFLHLLKSEDNPKHYRYARSLNAFILGNEDIEAEHVRCFVDDLPDRIEVSSLPEILKTADEHGIPAELVELQIHADFKLIESVQIWQRGKLSIHKMCREVLPSFDPDGIHISSPEEIEEFRSRLIEMFGREVRISETDRALVAIICDVGMLRDRGTYVAAREGILSEDLLSRIRVYIDQGGSEVFMFSTLFDAFADELMDAGVDNRYFLQGILRHEWDGIYSFSRDCISKGERATNIYGAVEDYIKNAGRLVYTSELKEAFPGVTDAVMNFALMQKKIISCNGRYIHADNLQLDDALIQKLHKVLDELLSDGFAHHGKELYDRASSIIGNWLDEMNIPFQSALYSVAAYLFDSEYLFSRPWIAIKGTAGEQAIRESKNQASNDYDEGNEIAITQGSIEYKGTLLDVVITVMQKATDPMTLQDITSVIQNNKLYQINSSNPSLVIYQVLNNAILGKGSRNAMLGRYVGTHIDDHGRRVYYLRDTTTPIYTHLIEVSTQHSSAEEKPAIPSEMATRWNQIISEEFEDGLRLNGMRLRKFRSIYEERFHEKLEAEDDKLIAQLKVACDFRDDRIYPKQDANQNTLINSIRDEITSLLLNGATGIYPQQVFTRYQTQLADQLSIYTADSLKSLLLASPKKNFTLMYGIFCLPGKTCNPRIDVTNLFRNCYEPLNYAQMSERLWYIPLDRIKHELVTDPSIVNVDQETYFYASNFPISTHELVALQRAMHRRIEDEGYIVAKDLRELMQEYCPNAVMDTAEWKDWGVRNVMAWLMRDSFEFNGVVVCAKGVGMDTHQVFRSYCRAHSRVTLDELKDLCSQLNVSGIYWDSVMAEMVRVSKTEFVSKSIIHFEPFATDQALSAACPGDYMALKDFTLFMTLPSVEYPWNGYLLESYLRGFSQAFYLNQAGPTEHTYIGAMVKRSSLIRTHHDLLIDVLAHDDTWESAKEAFAVLRDGGYRSYSSITNGAAMLRTAHEMREKRRASEK